MNTIYLITWGMSGFISALIVCKVEEGGVTIGNFLLYGLLGICCGYLAVLFFVFDMIWNAAIWIADNNSNLKIKINNFLNKKIF